MISLTLQQTGEAMLLEELTVISVDPIASLTLLQLSVEFSVLQTRNH
jgi:hypothetical protein